MRGKHEKYVLDADDFRITPADAGKTSTMRFALAIVEDHPRGCGENLSLHLVTNSRQGSPPRMRGKPHALPAATAWDGITPADAGKTGYIHT